MSVWTPARFAPIEGHPWAGEPTPPAERRAWRGKIAATTVATDLSRELRALLRHGTSLVAFIYADLTPGQIVRNGADLRPGSAPGDPGVMVEVPQKEGARPLLFASDRFTTWLGNLRAIERTMNALRAVDRWDVAAGQQYAGFEKLQLTTGSATHLTPREVINQLQPFLPGPARALVEEAAEGVGWPGRAVRIALIEATRATHPDRGGDPAEFNEVTIIRERWERQEGGGPHSLPPGS